MRLDGSQQTFGESEGSLHNEDADVGKVQNRLNDGNLYGSGLEMTTRPQDQAVFLTGLNNPRLRRIVSYELDKEFLVGLGATTATSATAGVAQYLIVNIGDTNYKIPVFNV